MVFKEYINCYKKKLILEESVLQGFFALRDGLSTAGIQIEMVQAWRGEAEQNADKAAGKSKAAWGSSPHNFGVAFDIEASPRPGVPMGWPDDPDMWAKIGHVGKSAGLTWGGDFKSIHDEDHFELTGWEHMHLPLLPVAPSIAA